MSGSLRLHKHHALGNDFLVLVAPENDHALTTELVVLACDRHRGIGADGLMRVAPAAEGDADLTMVLRNADGSPAEMSGNGLRCLVQAALRAGLVEGPEVRVATDAGLREVRHVRHIQEGTDDLVADMGEVVVGDEAPEWTGPGIDRATFASTGNPHLVLLAPERSAGPDLDALGALANEKVPGGVNVELVTPGAEGDLAMAVYERGVGRTLACGTGACAAAGVARAWGVAGSESVVRMPGGAARIVLEGDRAHLGGAVTFIADVDLAWA